MKYRAVILAAAAVATLGVACSGGDDDDTNNLNSASANQESGGSEGEQAAVGNASGDVDNSLGSAEGSHPADPLSENIPLKIDVTRLERNGDLVELEVVLTNASDPAAEQAYEPYSTLTDPSIDGGGRYDVSGINLVDGDGKKAYLPVLDGEELCVCTDVGSTSLAPGDQLRLSATFGGVPEDLDRVDVHVPGFTAIAGLALGG